MANQNNWMRNKDGMGIWEHRGKVAVAGWGQSHIDRRWDGVSMDRTMGAWCIQACLNALDDAGLTVDDIDGIFTSKETRLEQTWAPRPYFEPPYNTEDGLSFVTGEWIQNQMGLKNAQYFENNAPPPWGLLPLAAQAVGDGLCKVALVYYPMGNYEGRYGHNNPNNFSDDVSGPSAFSVPWGYQSGAMMNNLIIYKQYCRRYNKSHDGLAPLAINNRRNGLKTPWSFYSLHEQYQITMDDYLSARVIMAPLRIFDCDRPVMNCGAYIITTAERAEAMKQPPVYILNHATGPTIQRSTFQNLDEQQEQCAILAKRMWEGSGLGPKDVDVFNPYDGYLTFVQQYLEAFQWHGVGLGEAHDLYADDIRVEGPHPFNSSGGNNGTGRTRNALMYDCIQQLRGQAGERQVTVPCDIAVGGFGDMTMFSKHPS